MINFLLWLSSIILISAYTLYLNRKMNSSSQKLELREIALKNEINNFLVKENKIEEHYKDQLEIAVAKAKIICKEAQDKVGVLQNKINKLEVELSNARRKSKRLAEKIQKLV